MVWPGAISGVWWDGWLSWGMRSKGILPRDLLMRRVMGCLRQELAFAARGNLSALLRDDSVSVVVRKKHRRQWSIPFSPDVIRDDPDGAVLGSVVAGEEASVTRAGCFIIGGHVVRAHVAPIASGMAIEQGCDLLLGNGGGESGGGDDAAKVVAHGWMS